MNIIDEIKESFKEGSVLTRLIYINLGVFLLIHLVEVMSFLTGYKISLVEWFALPDNPHDFIDLQ